MPLIFTEAQRRALSTRLMVQPPESDEVLREFHRHRMRKTIEGLPLDVLMTLEALKMLAETGNKTAAVVYQNERIRLGIDRPSWHGL